MHVRAGKGMESCRRPGAPAAEDLQREEIIPARLTAAAKEGQSQSKLSEQIGCDVRAAVSSTDAGHPPCSPQPSANNWERLRVLPSYLPGVLFGSGVSSSWETQSGMDLHSSGRAQRHKREGIPGVGDEEPASNLSGVSPWPSLTSPGPGTDEGPISPPPGVGQLRVACGVQWRCSFVLSPSLGACQGHQPPGGWKALSWVKEVSRRLGQRGGLKRLPPQWAQDGARGVQGPA